MTNYNYYKELALPIALDIIEQNVQEYAKNMNIALEHSIKDNYTSHFIQNLLPYPKRTTFSQLNDEQKKEYLQKRVDREVRLYQKELMSTYSFLSTSEGIIKTITFNFTENLDVGLWYDIEYQDDKVSLVFKTTRLPVGMGYDLKSVALSELLNNIPELVCEALVKSKELESIYSFNKNGLEPFKGGCGIDSTINVLNGLGFKVIRNIGLSYYLERIDE